MPLNKQRGNMYGWVSHTWNPLAGACPHSCHYCSTDSLTARSRTLKQKYSGEPRIVKSELRVGHGSGNTIFVCNMSDLFAEAVATEIILQVLERCRSFTDNTYLFQSKNPARFLEFEREIYPEKVIFCTTIETNIKHDGLSCAPIPRHRADAMIQVKERFPWAKTSVTVEPILDFWEYQFADMLKEIAPDFLSIGADSKRHGLDEPAWEKVIRLIDTLERAKLKVERKSNLERLIKQG